MQEINKENKEVRQIDVEQIDLEKLKEKIAENPSLLPYAHTVGGVVIKPEDQGRIKANALEAMYQQTDMQMDQIYKQIQLLAEQAKTINTRKAISERVYQAEMRFEPLIGKTYYLYERHEKADVLSLIAPNEWGRSKKYDFCLATIRLLADHTWEVLDVFDK
ncbi:MAG: DUF2452 domain-containing protein [Thermoflexibacter sp.]|jgi:hypothetical protein|nr:DUF2452 domain-containing protein [Thermoflexibacter sp.]